MNISITPLVSVVTVCYNCKDEIEKTLNSVFKQTYGNIEYIIIDGGSTDGTVDIIKKHSRIISKFISEPDKGVYDAMNKGIDMASGEWINFMNAGDYFTDDKVIEEFFRKSQNMEHSDILYGDTIVRYPFGEYYLKAEGGHWFHQSIFAKASLLKSLKFNLHYKICADHDFLMRAGGIDTMTYIPRVVSNYEHSSGLSSTQQKRLFLERSEINGIPKNLKWYIKLCVINLKEYINKLFHIKNWSCYKKYIERKTIKALDAIPYINKIPQ